MLITKDARQLATSANSTMFGGRRGDMQFSDHQREMLCEMTNSAYLEIRRLAEVGRFEQGFALAAAFHHLLDDIWSEEFDLQGFRDKFLDAYQSKYPDPATKNYVAWLDLIIAMEIKTGSNQNSAPEMSRAPK